MLEYSNLSDNQLASLLKGGDSIAFTEIYNRYNGLLYIHAYKRLQNREEVNDLIQELFTTLWNRRKEINFTGHLSGYLYTAIRNRVIDFFSKRHYKSEYIASFQKFTKHSESETDHLIREKQLKDIIEQEISLLPPKMREVFQLSRKANLSHKEIAEKLDLSEHTVKKHVNNALKILRAKLSVIAYLILLSGL